MRIDRRVVAFVAAAVMVSGQAVMGGADATSMPAALRSAAPTVPPSDPVAASPESPAAEAGSTPPTDPVEASKQTEAERDRMTPTTAGEPVFAQRGDTTIMLPPDPATVVAPETPTAPVPASVTVTRASDAATSSASASPTESPSSLAPQAVSPAAVAPQVSGVVTSGGAPLSGATVISVSSCNSTTPLTTTTTAANGTYTLGLTASVYSYDLRYVRFSAAGKVPETFDDGSCVGFPVHLSQAYTNVNADLAPAGTISGTVTREDANPLGSVTVTASTFGFSATTTTTGAYTLQDLPPGVYTVFFNASDSDLFDEYYNGTRVYQQSAFVTVTGGATASGISASLTPLPAPGTIQGTVVDELAAPLGSVTVTAYLLTIDSLYGYEYWTDVDAVLTNPDGTYSLPLAPGSYRIGFDKSGYAPQYFEASAMFDTASNIPVASGVASAGIDATMLNASSISGVVTGAGAAPLDGAAVRFGTVNPAGYFEPFEYFGQLTGPDGSFTIPDVPPGDWAVEFSMAGYITEYWNNTLDASTATLLPVPASTDVTAVSAQLALGGSISGNVSSAGGPVQYAQVFACRSGATDCTYAQTDANGDYTIDALRSASYVVQFSAYSLASEYYNNKSSAALADLVAVTAPATTSGIDAVLAAGVANGGSLSGVVTGAGGFPLGSAQVQANGQSTYTNASGQYSFPSLLPGAYFLTVWSSYYITEYWSNVTDPLLASAVTVTSGGSLTANIELAPMPAASGATISGTATAPYGGAIQVTAARVGGPNLGYQPYSQTSYIASGAPYTFTVVPGTYDVCFYGVGAPQKCVQSVVVANGANVPVNATLAKTSTVKFTVTESNGSPAHSGSVSPCYAYVDPTIEYDSYGFDYCFDFLSAQVTNGVTKWSGEPGTYQFRVSTPNGSLVTPYIVVPPGASTVPITMPAPVPNTASISGTVRGPDGQPIAGVPVYAGSGGETVTAADGSYLLSGLRAAPQTVDFGPYGTAPVPYRREGFRDDTQGFGSLVSPPAGGTLSGVNARLDALTAVSGTGPAGRQVCVGIYFLTDCTTTSPAGAFTIFTQPGQTVNLCDPISSNCFLVNGSTTPISIGWRPITGLVLTDASAGGGTISGSLSWNGGAAPPNMQVLIQGVAGTAVANYSTSVTITGSSYSVSNLPAGSYTVAAQPQYFAADILARGSYYRTAGSTNRASLATPVTVTAGGTTSGINIAIQRAGRLKVTVTSSGIPVPNSYVSFSSDNWSFSKTRAADGTVTLPYVSGDGVASAWRVGGTEADGDAVVNVTAAAGVETAVSIPLPAATRPDRPASLTATAGTGSASLTWTAPASTGGSPITGYVVQVDPAPLRQPATYNVTGTSLQIIGLTNASRYTFSVRAANSVGAGPPKLAQTIPNGCIGTPFTDIGSTYVFCEAIDWMVGRGITTGFANSTFAPQQPINRDAMAAFLFRFAGEPTTPASTACGPSASVGPFTDVPPNYVFCRAIEWMKQTGITSGYPDGTFRPQQPINRDAMSAFLFRFAGSPTSPTSTACGPSASVGPFTDVPPNYVFCRAIEWMKQTGITTGYPNGTFLPGQPINRDAIAAFLFRFDDKNIAIG